MIRYESEIRQVRVAGEAELNLIFMRSTRFQKVKRNDVYVDIFGKRLWYIRRLQMQ